MNNSQMEWERERILLVVSRQVPQECQTFSLPTAEICERGKFTRAALIAAVGRQSEVHDLRITIDLASDRVLYQRTSRSVIAPIVTVPHAKPAPRPAPSVPQAIDPQAVGRKAREYQNAELAKGNEISATEAVAHVMAKRT